MKKQSLTPLWTFVLTVMVAAPVALAADTAASSPEEMAASLVSVNAVDPGAREDASFSDEVPATAADASVPEAYALAGEDPALAGKKITGIDIQGNRSIGVAAILAKIKTRTGDPFRQNVVSDDLKRLYNTGYFSDVRVDRKDEAGGVRVVIIVDEKPVVEEITFSRLRFISKRVILSKMKTQVGKFLDKKSLNDDLNTIQELYAKKGLTQVKVDPETFVDEATNKASLHLIIREGVRVRIKRINILGNAAYRDARIIKAMKSRWAWLFNSGYLKEDVLAEDMERIQAYYEKNGYIDARATYTVDQGRRGLVTVDVTVDEGRRYYVGDVQVRGNAVAATPEVLGTMKDIRPGKIFSRAKLADDVTNVKSMYFDRGYLFARVDDATSLDPATGKVDVTLDVAEGGIAYINKIRVQGNTRTRDIVIRRELRMYPGDQFNGDKLRRSKERLNRLGYFDEVGYDIQDTETADRKDLVVDVKEAKTGSFSFGGGYSTVDRLVGFIELDQRNFDFASWPTFTGGGQRVTARAEVGSSRNNMMLSFTEPWLFDYPVSGGFDIYRSQFNRESDTGYAYDQTRTGGKLRFGKELSEYVSAAAYYRFEQVDISNMQDNVSADLLAEVGKNNLSLVGLSLTNDHRDSVLSPRKGWTASVGADLAGGPLAGDKDFTRLETSGAYYIPLRFESVVEISGRVGMVRPYGDSVKVPIFERYFAGGARTIRGYDERGVGPYDSGTGDPVGGEGLFLGSIEYTIPLVDVVKFAVFADTGTVSAKYSDLFAENLYSGAGVGFRVKTPIGPMNLDYGVPLNKEPGEESRRSSGKFYFSVSRGF